MQKKISKTDIKRTEVIDVHSSDEDDSIEQELREMDIDALIRRLKFDESDPKIIKLIEKIIKEKRR